MYVAYELRSTCEEKAELQFQPAKFHRVLEIKLNSSIKKKFLTKKNIQLSFQDKSE